ncbi:MAG: PEGA domain-containing protein [Duncaniella sp.]|nr:PEGA domain-containing protein [Duncaniella sp.]
MKSIKIFLLLAFSIIWLNGFAAKKITITTIPENAEIRIDGSVVGTGSYQVKLDKNTEFYLVTISAPGYIEKRFRLLKSNPKASVLYTLPEDEAMAASTGSEDGDELANTWMDVTCRPGLTEDQIWKRLMSVATNYFDNVEVRDKASGWIKTRWKVTKFSNQTVRTRLEVRMSFVDDDHVTFKARISSEIKENDCTSDNCYKPYSRVLRKLEPMIQELQTSVGGGE